ILQPIRCSAGAALRYTDRRHGLRLRRCGELLALVRQARSCLARQILAVYRLVASPADGEANTVCPRRRRPPPHSLREAAATAGFKRPSELVCRGNGGAVEPGDLPQRSR